AGQDGVGACLVVLGAGFVHVGDRGQAHFQALVGIVELLLGRSFVGLGSGQRFNRHQHVEVGGGGAHDKIIVGRIQREVGGVADVALRTQGGELAPVEQGLAAVDAVVAGLAGGAAADAINLYARAIQRCLTVDLREQRCTCLYLAFLGVEPVG